MRTRRSPIAAGPVGFWALFVELTTRDHNEAADRTSALRAIAQTFVALGVVARQVGDGSSPHGAYTSIRVRPAPVGPPRG